jgi:hypothetical protein
VIYGVRLDFLNYLDCLDQLGYETKKPSKKYIFFKQFFDLMSGIYTVFILLLVLIISANCEQIAGDWFGKGNVLYAQGKAIYPGGQRHPNQRS